ncbi:SpoIIE family protein phosphatase [Curtobacterium sp. DN_7.5]|uniref:PP2C family protein-serine/threonine phosphatase n=1 Tax=Curtobacterium sp. DN_7.5 TaxID=3049047 RepID=UPI0033136163
MHGGNFRNVGWARSVGGDFYDWYPTPDGGAAVTLGDVMGKGVGAGMIAAAIRAVVRSSRDNPDPAAALRSATAGISTGPGTATSGQFTTCFHARISRNGVLCWVDAGHGLTGLLSVRLTPDLWGRGPRWKDVDHGQALSGGVPTRRDRGRATG